MVKYRPSSLAIIEKKNAFACCGGRSIVGERVYQANRELRAAMKAGAAA